MTSKRYYFNLPLIQGYDVSRMYLPIVCIGSKPICLI